MSTGDSARYSVIIMADSLADEGESMMRTAFKFVALQGIIVSILAGFNIIAPLGWLRMIVIIIVVMILIKWAEYTDNNSADKE